MSERFIYIRWIDKNNNVSKRFPKVFTASYVFKSQVNPATDLSGFQ